MKMKKICNIHKCLVNYCQQNTLQSPTFSFLVITKQCKSNHTIKTITSHYLNNKTLKHLQLMLNIDNL